MQLPACLIVVVSFCFWSSLHLLLDSGQQEVAQVPSVPNNPRETPEAKSGTLRSVFLASDGEKPDRYGWLNISVVTNITDHEYRAQCDPRSGKFNPKFTVQDGENRPMFFDSWVTLLRVTIIAAEYAYAFVCVPGLPVQLIDNWDEGWESAAEPLVGAKTTKMGQRRDPMLKIVGPVLMDVLLPPRVSEASKAYVGVKLREPARILCASMPWSSKVQFSIAIGQALQGVTSALVNGVIVHLWTFRADPFENVLAKTPMLEYRVSVWLHEYLLLTRLCIIYITIGALVGSTQLTNPLWCRSRRDDDNSSDWEPYPWGDWVAQRLIKMVTQFRALILPLAVMILISSRRETVGLVCSVGPAAVVTVAILGAVNKRSHYEIGFRRRVACILVGGLLGGLAISELGWRRFTPDIDLCVFARMVLIPFDKEDMTNLDRLFIELLDSSSVITYISFIIMSLICGLIMQCVWTCCSSFYVDGLFHALWIIRSYKALQDQDQQELRRSMLCALGALWDRGLEQDKQKAKQIVEDACVSANEETLVKDVSISDSAAATNHDEMEMIRRGAVLWWHYGLQKSAKDIMDKAPFSAKEFKQVGFSATEIKEAGLVRQLKDAGFTPKDLNNAAFDPKDMRDAGFRAEELRDDLDFLAPKLKDAGYSADELKQAHFHAACLLGANFSDEDLAKAGFTALDLTQALGMSLDSAKQLKEVGFSKADLVEARFTDGLLRQAGFS